MKLLVDEQKLGAELAPAIRDGRVAMIGLIRHELLSGIREEVRTQIRSLGAPPQEDVEH